MDEEQQQQPMQQDEDQPQPYVDHFDAQKASMKPRSYQADLIEMACSHNVSVHSLHQQLYQSWIAAIWALGHDPCLGHLHVVTWYVVCAVGCQAALHARLHVLKTAAAADHCCSLLLSWLQVIISLATSKLMA